jgi:hypothetical protein
MILLRIVVTRQEYILSFLVPRMPADEKKKNKKKSQ